MEVRDAATKARGILKSLNECDTLVGIICLSDLLTCTHGLSKFLQQEKVDVKSARNELSIVLEMLERRRKKSDEYFKNIFEEITGVAEEIGCEITLPRVVKNQIHRKNYPSTDPETYYRQSIYIPALDNLIADLKSRFSKETVELYNFSVLFPENDGYSDIVPIKKLLEKYSFFLDNPTEILIQELQKELERWCIEWKEKVNLSSYSAIELLNNCNPVIYPRIHFFLRIAASLAVSNATPERTFSALNRLETWLRTTMTQERITGLAMLHIHKNIEVDIERVIDRYAKKRTAESIL